MTFYIQVTVNQFNMTAILRRKTQMLYSGSNKRKVITPAGVLFNMRDLCLLRVANYGNARIGRASKEMVRKKPKIFKR